MILAAGAPLAAQRLRQIFLRAGLPGELLTTRPAPGEGLEDVCRRVHDLQPPARRGTLVVLEGAPEGPAGRGRPVGGVRRLGPPPRRGRPARDGRGRRAGPRRGAARRRRAPEGRRPAAEDTDIGPSAPGVFATPEILDGLSADDPRFTAPEGLTLAVVEVPDADTAVRVAARDGRDGPISVWARDRYKGERVSRRLPSQTTWFGRHGLSPTAVEVRMQRHVVPRQLEWRAPWAPGTPRLPAKDVPLMTALAEVRHGRESRRWPALRELRARRAQAVSGGPLRSHHSPSRTHPSAWTQGPPCPAFSVSPDDPRNGDMSKGDGSSMQRMSEGTAVISP